MDEKTRKLLSAENDLSPGDMVRRRGSVGLPGIIENVNIKEGNATVAWSREHHEILPLGCLKRCPPGGWAYDVRIR